MKANFIKIDRVNVMTYPMFSDIKTFYQNVRKCNRISIFVQPHSNTSVSLMGKTDQSAFFLNHRANCEADKQYKFVHVKRDNTYFFVYNTKQHLFELKQHIVNILSDHFSDMDEINIELYFYGNNNFLTKNICKCSL